MRNRAGSIFCRAEQLTESTSISLIALADLKKRITRLEEGFDNVVKMTMRKEGMAGLVSNPLVTEIVPKLRGATAYARFANALVETKLAAACANTSLTLFHVKAIPGSDQIPFVSYFVERAALSHIQQHLARCEYNILQQLKSDEMMMLTASEIAPAALINLEAVRAQLQNIQSVTTQSLQEMDRQKNGEDFSLKIIGKKVKSPPYKTAVENYVRELITMIDSELRRLAKQGRHVEACHQLRVLAQNIAVLQDHLAQYHIDLNSVVSNAFLSRRYFEVQLKTFQKLQAQVLRSDMPDNVKRLITQCDPADPAKDNEFITELRVAGDALNNQTQGDAISSLLTEFELMVSLRDSEAWRQEKAYLEQYPHDESEKAHADYRGGVFNMNNASSHATLADAGNKDAIKTLMANAAKFLEEGDEVKLDAESINYISAEHSAEIKQSAPDVLVAHYAAELKGKNDAQWLAMQPDVGDFADVLVKGVVAAAGRSPLAELTKEDLSAILQDKLQNYKKNLDPQVKDYLNRHGVELLAAAINLVAIKDENLKNSPAGDDNKAAEKAQKLEIEQRVRVTVSDGIKAAFENKSKMEIDQKMEILRASLMETPELSDVHFEKVATSIAIRVIQAADFANCTGKYPKTLLRVAVTRDVVNTADAAMQKVDQTMQASLQPPKLPTMRDAKTVKLSRKENEGLTVTVRNPKLGWTKKATVGSEVKNEDIRREENQNASLKH